MSRLLNYSVCTSTRPQSLGMFVVTAEYLDGYEVLSYHETKDEADRAARRYERKNFWARRINQKEKT